MKNKENLVHLKTAEAFLDKETGNTYDELLSGKPDKTPIHINDRSSSWWDLMNSTDLVEAMQWYIGLSKRRRQGIR